MANFLGWYGEKNTGDEAFKDALEVLTPGVNHNFSCKPQDGPCILGAGDVIKSYYLDMVGENEFGILGAGLGYESELELLRYRQPKFMYLRNRADVCLAWDAGFKQAEYCPDLAFALEPWDLGKVTRERKGGRKRALVILSDAINPSINNQSLSKHHYAEYYKFELAKALSDLVQWYDLDFLPFSDHKNDRDMRCIWDVVARMKDVKYSTFESVIPPRRVISMMKYDYDLVVSAKFHGLIFSTIAGTPFVNIGNSRKTGLFCHENGLEEISVPSYSFTYGRFMACVSRAEHSLADNYLTDIAKKKQGSLEGTSLG